MPAISLPVVARDFAHIAKRSNWAGENAGVMVVFSIVFVVFVGLVALFISKKVQARKEKRAAINA
ncbi:hypothetical protein C8A05DRAFT_35616 [Staphylotrichum tortipilum]|uniref:Uncharacterized protein n=1 Tax=Staphylotrichum tortipilum TaxID=2831512 RepID=A0AAN6MIY1_9PEZI|nr:hypothetical protein C8A05DRAFT_35616 [Staphylotrichum longicolle]